MHRFQELTGEASNKVAITLIIEGSFILIALLGCCGTIKENHCMLVTYRCMMKSILFIDLPVTCLLFFPQVFIPKLSKDALEDRVKEMIKYENETDSVAIKGLDAMQLGLKCCGAINASDWKANERFEISYPYSCCAQPKSNQTFCTDSFKDECVGKIDEHFRNRFGLLGGIAIIIAVIIWLAIKFLRILIRNLGKMPINY